MRSERWTRPKESTNGKAVGARKDVAGATAAAVEAAGREVSMPVSISWLMLDGPTWRAFDHVRISKSALVPSVDRSASGRFKSLGAVRCTDGHSDAGLLNVDSAQPMGDSHCVDWPARPRFRFEIRQHL